MERIRKINVVQNKKRPNWSTPYLPCINCISLRFIFLSHAPFPDCSLMRFIALLCASSDRFVLRCCFTLPIPLYLTAVLSFFNCRKLLEKSKQSAQKKFLILSKKSFQQEALPKKFLRHFSLNTEFPAASLRGALRCERAVLYNNADAVSDRYAVR